MKYIHRVYWPCGPLVIGTYDLLHRSIKMRKLFHFILGRPSVEEVHLGIPVRIFGVLMRL